jgi:hypothetical protein
MVRGTAMRTSGFMAACFKNGFVPSVAWNGNAAGDKHRFRTKLIIADPGVTIHNGQAATGRRSGTPA